VVLELEIEVAFAEDLGIETRFLRRGIGLPLDDEAGDLACETGAARDDPLVMLLDELVVDPRLVVEALHVARGHEPDEVRVSRCILGDHHEVMILVARLRAGFDVAGIRCDVEFAAYERIDAVLPAGVVEFQGAEHVPVVGEGEVLHPELDGPGHQFVHGGRSVEETVIRVIVEMYEIGHEEILTHVGAFCQGMGLSK
jgi:hypothetical protein